MQILFYRDNQPIKAKIIKTTIEPLDNSNSRQVVFFCQDAEGRRYRVPKSEIIAKTSTIRVTKEMKKSRKTKKNRRKARR